MQNKVIIIGAGGHGKVVAETIIHSGRNIIVGFADEYLPLGQVIMDNYKVLARPSQVASIDCDYFVVAIGDNRTRAAIYENLKKSFTPLTVIHPFSYVSPYANIEEGCVILPGAVVSYGSTIGENSIINSNAHIDHETVIGPHCHIKSGCYIGSNCTIDPLCETAPNFSLASFSHLNAE